MCPNMLKLGECPRGSKCTYAHSEEEKDLYRGLNTKGKTKPRSGEVVPPKSASATFLVSVPGDQSSDGLLYSSLGSVLGHAMGSAVVDYGTSCFRCGVRVGDCEVWS